MADHAARDFDAVIVGHGFLGRGLLALLDGQNVLAVRRSQHSDMATSSADLLSCDVTTPAGVSELRSRLVRFRGIAYILLPPSAFAGRDPADALGGLIEVLSATALQRVVLVSSSGVYAGDNGTIISFDSVLEAHLPRALRLRAIEQLWQSSGLPLSVIRLGGLYGPNRVIGQDAVRRGDVLPGAGTHWLNLIHRHDAARGLVQAGLLAEAIPCALLSDGQPLRRSTYYGTLAHMLGAARPRFDATLARRGNSRRCDPDSSWSSLGLRPCYPDFRPALAELLQSARPLE